MTIILDPEETEKRILLQLTGDLSSRRVLEIGSGIGRLTWRFAHLAGSVVGLEPDAEKFSQANRDFPHNLRGKVEFLPMGLEEYAASTPKNPFDLAILSWSL